jgi:NADH-quinone oxidoreductase subunit I
MRRKEDMTFLERIYVVEVIKGVFLTFGILARNFILHVAHLFGLKSTVRAGASIQYPDERREYPARYRGRHRLTLYPTGEIKCTSCFLCATACPARCIYIEPCEHGDSSVEKFPLRYEIDTLLCIYCGYCVEACPVDAIRMDTGIHPEVYPPDPRMFIEDKETLMERSRALEEKGPLALYREHMLKMQAIEKNEQRILGKHLLPQGESEAS